MPGARTVSCLICRMGIIFACVVVADAADCPPVDRLPFAAPSISYGLQSLALLRRGLYKVTLSKRGSHSQRVGSLPNGRPVCQLATAQSIAT